MYEYLLSKLSTAGTNGQFRTPRHIIKMMVELLSPGPDERICDPACGTSGFLVAAGEYLKGKYKSDIFHDPDRLAHYHTAMFTGYDMDRTMLRIGAMNMMTHGVENPAIQYKDSLSDQNADTDKYTMILANPPFKGSLDADIVARFHDLAGEEGRERTEQSFLAPKGEIVENGYDLSINKYKKTAYVPVEYPSTSEIFAQLRELEAEIAKGLEELEGMV